MTPPYPMASALTMPYWYTRVLDEQDTSLHTLAMLLHFLTKAQAEEAVFKWKCNYSMIYHALLASYAVYTTSTKICVLIKKLRYGIARERYGYIKKLCTLYDYVGSLCSPIINIAFKKQQANLPKHLYSSIVNLTSMKSFAMVPG